jgi:hypothetical protein
MNIPLPHAVHFTSTPLSYWTSTRPDSMATHRHPPPVPKVNQHCVTSPTTDWTIVAAFCLGFGSDYGAILCAPFVHSHHLDSDARCLDLDFFDHCLDLDFFDHCLDLDSDDGRDHRHCRPPMHHRLDPTVPTVSTTGLNLPATCDCTDLARGNQVQPRTMTTTIPATNLRPLYLWQSVPKLFLTPTKNDVPLP